MLTALVIGFSAIEDAGLRLLLQDHRLSADSVDLADCDAIRGHVDVALIDLSSFDLADAVGVVELRRLVAGLRAAQQPARVVGVAGDTGTPHLGEDSCGLDAIVDRTSPAEVLVTALVEQPAAHLPWRRPTIAAPSLTEREREVLELVAGGCTSKVIAAALGISAHTVERHKQRLFRRLDVQNQAQAVAAAVRVGLLAPGAARSIAS